MNSTFRALAVAAVVVVAGVLGYFVLTPSDQPSGPAQVTNAALTPGGATEAPPPEEPSAYFAFRRLEIDTSRDAAEACLFFTRPLDAAGKVRYDDYLKFDPEVAVSLRVVDNRLCVAGLAFNQTYQTTLRSGLPAASGEKLQIDEVVPVALRDREPLIAFGSGLILPRENADGVPVSSINVSGLKIKLLRVSDRLVSQLQSGLVDQRVLYGYDERQLQENQASLIWEGGMAVAGQKNQTATTLFPIAKAIADQKPGVYVLLARDAAEDRSATDDYWRGIASQWVINSDIGLTSFSSPNGTVVFARSLKTGRPMPGVEVALVSRGNVELARATADATGKAAFDPGVTRGTGADEAVMAMAYAGDDFTFLDLRRPAFDLSDRGVAGRSAPGPVDAFLFTERGVYRPGETVHLAAMLRDPLANAQASAPLTVVVSRPDGMEWRRFTLNGQQAGGAALDILLSDTAMRGQWEAAAYLDPKGQAIGRIAFDVQDFVPQRLKVALTVPAGFARPGQPLSIPVEGRFLYGAPAAGVGGEGGVTIVADPAPFPALEGYSFGRVDEKFEAIELPLTVAPADAAGKTAATAEIGAVPDTSLPLVGKIRVALYEPGGRMTTETASIPVRTRDLLIGIRPGFQDGSVQENTEARFEVIAVDAAGSKVAAPGLTYALVREDIDYQWYQDGGGEWRYETVVRDRVLAQGALDVKADAPAKVGQVVEWGSYRLTVSDRASGASSAVRFWGGWAARSSGDRPDRVAVAAAKETYAAGETARIDIRPPSDGQALVVVANDRILDTRLIDAPAGGASIDIPVSAEWGAGAYVLVTHYRALDSAQSRAPVRAVGVAWLGVDQTARTLNVTFAAPEKVRPRQTVDVPVQIANAGGEEAYLTLAAVDEGILQLTDYVTPDPAGHYFGKRRLGVDMRDDYGRLIESSRAMVGELRSGGDSLGSRSLALVPQRTVALFSGVVKADAQGRAVVKLDVPDFNGELRLMAAAWTPTRVGRGERPLTVRDAVVAELTLPRFLAPGDAAAAALTLHNVEGGAGSYTATITASGAVAPQTGDSVVLTANLPVTQRTLLPVPLQGKEPGIGTIALKVTGPNGFEVSRSWGIEVRSPALPQASETVALQNPGESFELPKDLLAAYVPGTTSVAVTLTGARGFDNVAGMLRWLDRYPFGCLEQLTSRAFPLVYFNDMALLAGAKQDLTIPARVQEAVDRVGDMQLPSGGFGMWSSLSGESDAWLSVYAIDFLVSAKAKGYVVPQDLVTRALGWLRQTAGGDWQSDHARAYAFYVLAGQGAVNPGEVRYFADNRVSGMTNPLAVGLTGAALAAIGDKARAAVAFARVREMVQASEPTAYVALDYGSYLRDLAGLTYAAAGAQDMQSLPLLLDRAGEIPMRPEWTTTQEKGWMLLAAHALRAQAPAISADVKGADGSVKDNVLRLSPADAQIASGVTLVNTGQKPVWRIVSVDGVPAQTPPAAATGGLRLARSFWTLDGRPADLAALKQNEQVIVKIEGGLENNFARDMAVLDLLPAGMEIEAGVTPYQAKAAYPWLGELTALSAQQLQDDRYVATFSVGSRYRPTDGTPEPQPVFALAYVLRAVTPGSFVLPPANAEDMYAPGVRARTDGGRVTIAAAQ